MPQAQTVDLPKRLPLLINPENRADSTDKDARLVNCYTEKLQNGDHWIFKRAGVLRSSQPSGGTAAGYGMFNWLGDVYSIFGNKLYKNGVAIAGTVDTTNGVYRFASCLGATPRLVFGNGVKAYTYSAGPGLAQITDLDFPSAFVKGWCYLDGTMYVGTTAARIQGSDLNDPSSWDPLNVLVAQIEPDGGVAMAHQLVYVVFMKQWSTEIFYDAGNATGSPLGTVQGAKVNYGCVSQDTVQSIDGILMWVSTNQSASVQVVKFENLKADVISTAAIERLLDDADFSAGNVYSLQFKNVGHRFYVLTLKTQNLTLVYDLNENMWHQWTDPSGNYFPFVASTYDSLMEHYFQHESDGYIYKVDESYYTDNGLVITVDIYTPNFDGGTRRKKQMTMLEFVADQVDGSTLQVRSNDYDFDTTRWSNFRLVDLSKRRPFLQNCGTFRRRAYNFRHQSQTSFRMQAVDMQLDLGTL